MLEDGYIKLYRSLLKWEWYDDINTKVVFLHLLLTVNHYDEQWHGVLVKRGSRISSYGKLAKETRLSVQNVRTSIKRLISTGELTHSATAEYGMFTIVNYEKYQCVTHDLTESQQSANTQPTHSQQQSKKAKKARKQESKKYIDIDSCESLVSPDIANEWRAFVEMRVAKKKPLSEYAADLAIKELDKLAGNDIAKQKAILNQSVFYQWLGLFKLKDGDNNGRPNKSTTGAVQTASKPKYGNVYE